MDPLAQIPVHQVSLTSVESNRAVDGSTELLAAVGIWCDLSSIPDEAMPWAEGDDVPSVRLVDAYLLPDRTRLALSVQASDVAPEDVRAAAAEDLNLSPFTIVVPTSAVALVTSLMAAPVSFHLILVDGTPPSRPEFTVLDQDEVAAIVELDPNLTHDALCGTVERHLHMPIMFEDDDHEDNDHSGGPQPMRDTFWSLVSGVALGQPWAMQRLTGVGVQAAAFAASDALEDKVRAGDMATAAARLSDASYDAVRDSHAIVNLATLPAVMSEFSDQIRDTVSVEALMLLTDGVPFDRVAAEHGLDRALPALAVVAAVRAHTVAVAEAQSGASVSWLLGAWLDHDFAEPVWAARPLVGLLAHHDVAVATDLLGVGPAGSTSADASKTLTAFLHIAAGVLVEFEMDAEEMREGMSEHSVRPPNHHDVALLSDALLGSVRDAAQDAHADDVEVCLGCSAVEAVLDSGWDLKRLAAASAALLPCLADVAAGTEGLAVGDEDWVQHRTVYLGRFLDMVSRNASRIL